MFPYATAQRLDLGSHRQRFLLIASTCHFHSTWGMEIPARVKVKGSPRVAHSSPSILLANLLPALHLILIAYAFTEMKPKASAYPGMTRSCDVVTPLTLSHYGCKTPLPHMHTTHSKMTFPFHSISAEYRVVLQLTFLEISLSSFQLTFQWKLLWVGRRDIMLSESCCPSAA